MNNKLPIINIDIPALTTDMECGLKGGFTSLSTLSEGDDSKDNNETNIFICNFLCFNKKNCNCTDIEDPTTGTAEENNSGGTNMLGGSILF